MILYPAIDLIGGRCVRLYKGDFNQQTTYETSPVEMACTYASEGAKWLHLVDLDGAKSPDNRQLNLISDIISQSGLKVQTGGGIRSPRDVEALLAAGAQRVVIGSLALKKPEVMYDIIETYGPERLCLAADVHPKQGGYAVAVSGWQEDSNVSLFDLLSEYSSVGLRHVLCTDISVDGTLGGCNFDLYEQVMADFPTLKLQASGGVSSLDDLRSLRTDGAIIGKALYEGIFTVEQALAAVGGQSC